MFLLKAYGTYILRPSAILSNAMCGKQHGVYPAQGLKSSAHLNFNHCIFYFTFFIGSFCVCLRIYSSEKFSTYLSTIKIVISDFSKTWLFLTVTLTCSWSCSLKFTFHLSHLHTRTAVTIVYAVFTASPPTISQLSIKNRLDVVVLICTNFCYFSYSLVINCLHSISLHGVI